MDIEKIKRQAAEIKKAEAGMLVKVAAVVKKAAEPIPGDETEEMACDCGSSDFLIDEMRLVIRNTPLKLNAGGYDYDDTKGDSDGWDFVESPNVTCAKCGNKYRVEQTKGQNLGLGLSEKEEPVSR